MKTLFNLSIIALFMLLTSCQDEQRGQYPIHGGKPNMVTKVIKVEPFGGGADIYYELPTDRDILYVVARYTLDTGQEMLVKVSKFQSSVKIDGFRDEAPRTVELRTVDRSQNESEPLNVVINPYHSPIFDIAETLEVSPDFGGIKCTWKNEGNVPILLLVTIPMSPIDTEHDLNNEVLMRQVGSWSSEATNGKYNVRGFPSESQVFAVQIRDRWGNYTELYKGEYTPRFEQLIPKSKFVRWNGDPNLPYSRYSASYEIERLWNDDLSDMYHTADPTVIGMLLPPKAFSFDMGAKYVLSRFKLWHRSGASWAYTHHDPKEILVYGSNHPTPMKRWDDSELPEHQAQRWVFLGWFDTPKPSGLPLGQTSAEDIQLCHVDGIDYEFESATEPFRYYRFDVPVTWSLSAGIHIAEATFWGEEYIEVE